MVVFGIVFLLAGLFGQLPLKKNLSGLNGSIVYIWKTWIFGLSELLAIPVGTGENF